MKNKLLSKTCETEAGKHKFPAFARLYFYRASLDRFGLKPVYKVKLNKTAEPKPKNNSEQ